MFKIVSKKEIVPNVHLMEIEAPEIPPKLQAGHFVIIMADDEAERLPFSLTDWNVEKGTITIMFLEAGWSTRKLVKLKAGDTLAHVVGPLGKASDIIQNGSVICVGGCFGLGAILPLSRTLKSAGNKITTIVEAKGDYLICLRDMLEQHCDEFLVATSDGSKGRRGHGWDIIDDIATTGRKIDRVYSVGCTFMMKRTCDVTKKWQIPTMVWLNPIMVDGTGMCGCCRVSVGGKTLFACVDGPEFDGHKVDWGELGRRRAMYPEMEVEAFSQKAESE